MFLPIAKDFCISQKCFGPEWKRTITASKLSAFMHLDEFNSGQKMASQIFGLAPSPPSNDFQRSALEHGNKTEAVCKKRLREMDIKEFKRYTFRKTEEDGTLSYTAEYLDTDNDLTFRFSATPDMLLSYPWLHDGQPLGKQFFPVEIKCPYYAYIKGQGMGALRFKPCYWVQLMVQCIVTAAEIGYLVMYLPSCDQWNQPECMIVWRVNATDQCKNFVISNISKTYKKFMENPQSTDWKTFRARKGEKGAMYEKVEEMMKTTCKKVYTFPQ